jgi:hypothetical protein
LLEADGIPQIDRAFGVGIVGKDHVDKAVDLDSSDSDEAKEGGFTDGFNGRRQAE